MKTRLLSAQDGLRTFAVVFDEDEEVVQGLLGFAREQHVTGASLTAIGAVRDLTWGYFDWTKKDYRRTSLHEQVEVLSLAGNIALERDEPKVHAHIVIARADGAAMGGHLLEAHVRPTLEVVALETPGYLRRRIDDRTGLALIDLSVRA